MTIKKRILYIFLGFLPLLISFGLQFFAVIPTMGIALLNQALKALSSGTSGLSIADMINSIFSDYDLFTNILQLQYAIIACIFFGAWFLLVFRKDHGTFIIKRHFSLVLVFGLICLMIALQFLTNIVATIVATIDYSILESYQELIDAAGMTSPGILMIVYGVIIGPIAEELIFRGVTLHYFKRSMPFLLANILQAALFGLYHMNLMQGIYTFVVGLFFGFIFKAGGTLFYTILAHMIFNFFGFTEVLYALSSEEWFQFMWMPLMILCFIFGGMFYFSRLNRCKLS